MPGTLAWNVLGRSTSHVQLFTIKLPRYQQLHVMRFTRFLINTEQHILQSRSMIHQKDLKYPVEILLFELDISSGCRVSVKLGGSVFKCTRI